MKKFRDKYSNGDYYNTTPKKLEMLAKEKKIRLRKYKKMELDADV